jgi:methyltransferase (TIGR00027 family)
LQAGKPSRTAWAAAVHRAAHQIAEQGRIFSDPLAVRILGKDGEAAARESAADPSRRRMRIFIAVRTRLAEDWLAAAVKRGVNQLVVLGAGLDTFAYRSPFGEKLQIFEVDHPATQAWKRERLQDAGISAPSSLTYAPVDFERQILSDGLNAAGFDRSQPTFFTWLGVVPYLSQDAIWSTLGFIAGLPNGVHVVFDYSDPPDQLSAETKAYHDERAARVEAAGEAWVSYFEAGKLREKLLASGYSEVEDLGPRGIMARFFPGWASNAPEKGGHVLLAVTRAARSSDQTSA